MVILPDDPRELAGLREADSRWRLTRTNGSMRRRRQSARWCEAAMTCAMPSHIRGIRAGADDFLSKPVNSQELLARTRSLLRLREYTDELENPETVLFSLALSIEAKDPYTKGHCDRLSAYSEALGRQLGLTQEECVALRRAGVVHDVGKIGVPEHSLLKQSPLNEDEWAVMMQHPITGERICLPLKSFRYVLPIIRHHHEKLDGTGVPMG